MKTWYNIYRKGNVQDEQMPDRLCDEIHSAQDATFPVTFEVAMKPVLEHGIFWCKSEMKEFLQKKGYSPTKSAQEKPGRIARGFLLE